MDRRVFMKSGAMALVTMGLSPSFLRRSVYGMELLRGAATHGNRRGKVLICLFQRGATVSSLHGNPTEVVKLYERAVEVDGRHAGALFGLAIENDRYGNDEQLALAVRDRAGRNLARPAS